VAGRTVLSFCPQRLSWFGLTLHPDKTRLLEFGRDAPGVRRCQHGELRWTSSTTPTGDNAGLLVAGRIDDALEKGLNSVTAALGRNRDTRIEN
jgi:hypothetical protein